ncbi:hypothetical protein AB0M23_04860 [Streptomyces sp. NPDC052077]|uniref:hypothetical protein n=1 Tax=Streptomyces sp. NPDC052077 TaxID=3154757 RepID=UPI0034365A81
MLALVEVWGGERDWREAEGVFEARGWPVLGHFPRGEGPTAGVLEPDPSVRVYRVEVRIYGAARRAATGAAWQVEHEAGIARLTMQVRRADLINRAPKQIFDWRLVPSRALRGSLEASDQRALADRLGETHVSGSPGEALRLARRAVPNGVFHPHVAVRPLRGGAWSFSSIWKWKAPRRISVVVFGCILASLVASTAGRYELYSALASLGSCFTQLAYLTSRNGGRGNATPVLAMFGVMAMLAITVLADLKNFSAVQQMLITMLPFVLYGVWLIVRQWTWGEWVAWVAPLAVTLLLSSFVGAAPILHAWYAERLSVSAADLDVPALWQVASVVKLLSILVFLLMVPAAWGFARHRHLIRTGNRFNIMLYGALLSALVIGCAYLSYQSAERAASKTSLAAKKGEEAPPYFGIRPEWTCVIPVVAPERIASEGGRLDARHAYLSLGSTAGQVTLLEPGTAHPIKLPTRQVALIPAPAPRSACH